jgi:hypothetical protein
MSLPGEALSASRGDFNSKHCTLLAIITDLDAWILNVTFGVWGAGSESAGVDHHGVRAGAISKCPQAPAEAAGHGGVCWNRASGVHCDVLESKNGASVKMASMRGDVVAAWGHPPAR